MRQTAHPTPQSTFGSPPALTPLRPLILPVRALLHAPLRDWPIVLFGVADGALLLMLAYGISAALGIVRQVLFNAQFGLSDLAGAYYAAFRLPETIGLLVAGGTLTNALIPVLLRVSARDGEHAAIRLLNLTLTALLALIVPICIAAAIAAPAFVRGLLAPGLSPAAQDLTVALTRIMLLEVLLVVSEAVLVALLTSRGQFFLPALAIVFRNTTLIGGILLAAAVPGVGIYGPTLGAVLDALLQLLILAPGLRRRGYRPQLAWEPGSRDLRAVFRLLGPSAASSLVNYGGKIADTAFATIAGRAAALGAVLNAELLIGLPVRLLGIAVGQAALPRLANLALSAEPARARRTLSAALALACAGAALAAAALIALGRPLIRLLYERGQFDAAAGDLTYAMLTAYSLGLPAYVATELLSRALVARADTRTPLAINTIQLVVRIALIVALLGPLGALAIPTAFAVSSALEAGLLGIVVFRSSGRR